MLAVVFVVLCRKWYAVLDTTSNASSIDSGISLNAQLIKLPTTDTEDFQSNIKARWEWEGTQRAQQQHHCSVLLHCTAEQRQLMHGCSALSQADNNTILMDVDGSHQLSIFLHPPAAAEKLPVCGATGSLRQHW